METRELNFPPHALFYLTPCQFQLWMAEKENEEGLKNRDVLYQLTSAITHSQTRMHLLQAKKMQLHLPQAGLAGLGLCLLPNQMVVPTIRSQGVHWLCKPSVIKSLELDETLRPSGLININCLTISLLLLN